jgi:hypothetical protein
VIGATEVTRRKNRFLFELANNLYCPQQSRGQK